MIFSMGLKVLWTIAGLAIAMIVLAILSTVDFAINGDADTLSATFGFLFLAALLGIPSGIAIIRARARSKEQALKDLVIGFVRSRDSIHPQELARKTQLSELEAEAMLIRLNEANDVDLVFHRSRDEYLHRSRIAGAHRLFETCNSCGAALRAQVVFADESISCEYCNAPLNASASTSNAT